MLRKLFNLIPEGIQKKIKLYYYNFKTRDFYFSIEQGNYRTKSVTGWSILTKSPLYFIVRDVKRYEKYYSVALGDIVLDAGANVGILSLIYSKKVKTSGAIFAFEPDAKNFLHLMKNIDLNPDVENICLQERGLWSETDEILFYEAGSVGSSVFPNNETAIKKNIGVTTIDDFVSSQNLPKLNFVKMDIEGAEIQAVIGAKRTIKKMQPNFAIASYHFVNGVQTYKKIESIFQDLNYPFHTEFFPDGEIITYAGPSLNMSFGDDETFKKNKARPL